MRWDNLIFLFFSLINPTNLYKIPPIEFGLCLNRLFGPFGGLVSDLAASGSKNLFVLEKRVMNIYVGNLSYDTTEERLKEAFEQFGQVENISIIRDRQTGRSRGFAFVIMPDEAEAQRAIDESNGMEVDGRTLKVNQAREKSAEGGGGRGGRRGGGGGGQRRW